MKTIRRTLVRNPLSARLSRRHPSPSRRDWLRRLMSWLTALDFTRPVLRLGLTAADIAEQLHYPHRVTNRDRNL